MANTKATFGKVMLVAVKIIPFLLILFFLDGISRFENFPNIATAIVETLCDILYAMARLGGGSITMPRCLDRYSRFEQFPELPTEVQNMVFEAIGRTAKPRFQLLAYGAKPSFLDDPSRRSGNGSEFLLELKALVSGERNLLRHLDNPTAEYFDPNRTETTSIIHSWFRNKEEKELAAIEQVNGITYATSLGLSRVHPARCLYRHGDLGDRRRCTGRDDCTVRCNRSVRFSPKNDIVAASWFDEDIHRGLDAGGDIPDRFCLKVPALADVERFAFLHIGPEAWDNVYDRMVDHWPCHMPQLREVYLICPGDIEPIGSAALPAPFLESGGFKLTELDPTKVRFITEPKPKEQNMSFSALRRAKARDQNMAFDVVRRVQLDYDAKFHRFVTEVDRLPLEERDDLPEEYSRRRVQVKLVHIGLRDASLFRRYGTKAAAWASNKLGDVVRDAEK